MNLEFRQGDESTLLPYMNGQPMPFRIVKGKGFMILEASGSGFTMQNQRFTKTDSLKKFLIDAYNYLQTRKKKEQPE